LPIASSRVRYSLIETGSLWLFSLRKKSMSMADEEAVNRRADALLERIGRLGSGADARHWLDVRRPKWIMGTFDEARAAVRRYEAAGVARIMLQDLYPWDLEMIREMGGELVGWA